MKTRLLVRGQIEAGDRRGTLRMTTPGKGPPFLVLRAGAGDDVALPPCPYSLFEAYLFSTDTVSSRGPVKIWRIGKDEPITVDLSKVLNAADTASDVPLAWGDVVEFTTGRNYDIHEPAISDEARQVLEKYLARTIEFVWTDEEGKESRRQKLNFFPNWERAPVGRGWVPGRANDYSIVEGASEVSILPTLARLRWKDGEGKNVVPASWVVTRRVAEGETRSFEIDPSARREETAIPEDGDVVVLKGTKNERADLHERLRKAAADSGGMRRRRVSLPSEKR